MTCRLTHLINRFRRDEAGSVETISFAIWMPMIIIVLLTTLEVGAYTARATMLERAVDLVARDIRLGTGTAPQHDALKTQICDRAVLVPSCENQPAAGNAAARPAQLAGAAANRGLHRRLAARRTRARF